MDGQETTELAYLRKRIFLTACCGGIGHLASAYSVLEILYALYQKKILRYDPAQPLWEGRDRLIVSKGHASLAVYNILCSAGFFPEKELWSFCRPGSRLGGEAHPLEVPGVEASTGSLGHGLSFGTGIALAKKMDRQDSRVFVILGDGECQEGTVWEAIMSAAHFQLDNLTVILDCNGLQKMGTVNDIMSIDSWEQKWRAFGWHVDEIDGHDTGEIFRCLSSHDPSGKPKVVLAHTVKGKGVSIMENNPSWHWRMPSRKELKTVLSELDITDEELDQCKRLI